MIDNSNNMFNDDQGINIEIHSTESKDMPTIGSPYKGPVEIIVETEAWQQMNIHVRENMAYESGGLMFGDIYEHDGHLSVRVTDAIPARGAINQETSVRFTVEAWREMDAEMRDSGKGKKLVGWYHAHPDFTAFFSEDDTFMHNSFFDQPWHIALVIDPIREEYLFYRYELDQLVPVENFLLQVDLKSEMNQPVTPLMAGTIHDGLKSLTDEAKDTYMNLRRHLQTVRDNLRKSSGKSSFADIIRFIIDVSKFDNKTITEASDLLSDYLKNQNDISTQDLQPIADISSASAPTNIAYDWLIQGYWGTETNILNLARNKHERFVIPLHFSIAIKDMSILQHDYVVILTQGAVEKLIILSPRLSVLERLYLVGAAQNMKMRTIKINWRGQAVPNNVEKLLATRDVIYLIAPDALYILKHDSKSYRQSIELIAIAKPSTCNWETFDIKDWCVDPSGNLFLLGLDGTIWKYVYSLMDWVGLSSHAEMDSPQFISATWSYLSVYNSGENCALFEYRIHDLAYAHQRKITDTYLIKDKVRQFFTNRNHSHYFVTSEAIYLAD